MGGPDGPRIQNRAHAQNYNFNFISNKINKNMLINKALLKYGYANFSVEILEYCEPDEAISRQQHFLDLLKPDYNILKNAGSLLGFKHSDGTIAKIKAKLKGRVFTPEHLAKLSVAKIGNTYATGHKGRKRAEGAGSPSVHIEVLDQETGIKTIYPSMSAVAKALDEPSGSIRTYISRNSQKPYKGRYLLQKLAG